jgi:hypothetical protein
MFRDFRGGPSQGEDSRAPRLAPANRLTRTSQHSAMCRRTLSSTIRRPPSRAPLGSVEIASRMPAIPSRFAEVGDELALRRIRDRPAQARPPSDQRLKLAISSPYRAQTTPAH